MPGFQRVANDRPGDPSLSDGLGHDGFRHRFAAPGMRPGDLGNDPIAIRHQHVSPSEAMRMYSLSLFLRFLIPTDRMISRVVFSPRRVNDGVTSATALGTEAHQ